MFELYVQCSHSSRSRVHSVVIVLLPLRLRDGRGCAYCWQGAGEPLDAEERWRCQGQGQGEAKGQGRLQAAQDVAFSWS